MTTFLDKLEKRFGNYAIPNLTIVLLAGQIILWLLANFGGLSLANLVLAPEAVVYGGQWWRIASFLFVPLTPALSFWAVIAFYVFYLWGSALEGILGSFRYNCFIFCGAALTVVLALLAALLVLPQQLPVVSNGYLYASIFLAFAIFNPNFEILLFFILPMKMKWVGWLTVAFWVMALVGGSAYVRAAVLAAALNIALFFGRQWFVARKYRRRAENYQAQNRALAAEPFHRCSVCNVTDNAEPDLRFAYKDGKGYCERHWDAMDAEA